MSFLTLPALWFALAIPAVVLLYLLKKKRLLHLVPSTILWERFLAESQANSPFQKLRRSMLLLLQILAILLAVLALARPYLADARLGGALQVLLLDTSASMQSADVEPSRFEMARSLALDLVDGLRDTDQMVVVQAGARTTVVQSPTSDKATLRRAIGSVEVNDGPTRLLEALQLAETLVRDRADSEIRLISDGAVSELTELENLPSNLFFHQVGVSGDNVGLVGMDVRPHPEDPSLRAVFCSVANYSTNRHRLPVELWFEDRMLETRTLDLLGGQSRSVIFLAPQERDGVFRAELKGDDDLAVDDQASMVSLLPQPARILLYTPGNSFLEKALRSSGPVELTLSDDPAASSGDADIVVLDRLAPDPWPEGAVMAIDLVHTNWFSGWERAEAPAIMDWRSSHPLLRFVSFDEVYLAQAWSVADPWWGEPVVDSSLFPLIVAGEHQGGRRLWIGFDVLESTWPFRISFPVFMANAVEWLHPAASSGRGLSVRTGQTVRLPQEPGAGEAVVRHPGGGEERVPLSPDARSFLYGSTLEQGIYEAGSGDKRVRFAASLLDAEESDTTPRSSIPLGAGLEVEASENLRADLEVWRWIAALALLVLMFEWWYYHRRTA